MVDIRDNPSQSGAGRRRRRPDATVVPPAYLQVRRLLDAGCPLVFVSGNAGTGKTTLIHYLREQVHHRHVVLAPTGVAALNAGGMTIHSFFRFPPRILDPGQVRPPADPTLYQRLELIIIDEASMLRADLVDGIDRFLRACHGDARPFAGVQLLLLGDLFQLPPVTSRAEGEVLEARGYAGPYFFDAFALEGLALEHVELAEVFRQSDVRFVGLLDQLRLGEDMETAIAELNDRCCGESKGHEITLACTNQVADALNTEALAALPGEARLFLGQVEGGFNLDGDRLPSPLELHLKPGARVMFTKNDEDGRWVNGSLGTVTWISGSRVEVEMADGGRREVERVSWQSYRYRLDRAKERIVAEEVGRYTQFPLMLAWAVTIHKSQGKTLGRALVDLGAGAFAPGQVYVALSRCRSLDDLRLARPLRAADIKYDPRVRGFYQRLRREVSEEAL